MEAIELSELKKIFIKEINDFFLIFLDDMDFSSKEKKSILFSDSHKIEYFDHGTDKNIYFYLTKQGGSVFLSLSVTKRKNNESYGILVFDENDESIEISRDELNFDLESFFAMIKECSR
jgi:hypothetical protein